MTARRAYPSDISDARWALIGPTLLAWQQARLDRRPTAVEAWFLGGPVDGRLMPVEVTPHGSPPMMVKLPQTGFYLGAKDVPAPAMEHVYALADKLDGFDVYQYRPPVPGTTD
ncbi:hypothetical protein GA0070620_6533 [Micromonospora krabiensis]|uniref:Uncharacterized protein n=1 Tax=Micromonospora krabiensis TaxID=307121 RepID=A0A1C3NEA3_9ACTN|nr:hypothetical protein GA0070620_6533 [Micromonospora krabiensis]